MSWQQLSQSLAEKLQGDVLVNEPMKNHTTWKIGGPADLMVKAATVSDIIVVTTEAKRLQVPITIIGNGSNALIKDGGIRGIVLKIHNGLNRVQVRDNMVEAETGATLPVLARIAAKHNLTGLEFAAGIPATLGGAIVMNAGALGGEISTSIERICWIDMQGKIHYSERGDLEFSYRHANLPANELVLAKAWLKLEEGNGEAIRAKMTELLTKRKNSQPVDKPNAGSVFKNVPGNYAGKLIEDVGLKGVKVGGAQVSEKHANFIVNLGNATAKDVLALIELVKKQVLSKFNINLELEVKILGEDLSS